MGFLCQQHRRQVLQHTDSAINHWDQWMARGDELLLNEKWQQAGKFLGCSYEIGEWLLEQQPVQRRLGERGLSAVERYMIAGHHLAECMGRCGRHDYELHYLITVHRRLMSLVQNRVPEHWLLKPHLEISLIMLSRYCELQKPFAGYVECVSEARLTISQCLH